MSERWIQVSEEILKQIKRLEETEDRDRLELVRSLRFLLGVLRRSLLGWMQWVDNPEIMTRFTQDDLEKMTRTLSEFTRSFVTYDLQATQLGSQRGLKVKKKVKKKTEKGTEIFYV